MSINKIIFFDLDGTLLDTAPDFFTVLNAMLTEHRKPLLQYDLFKQHVYGNSDTMVAYAFDVTPSHSDFEKIRKSFLSRYQAACTVRTCFFTGISSLLTKLDRQAMPWGIVTNKPTYLAEPILSFFHLDRRAAIIVCGDTLSLKKPHPAPLLYACEKTNNRPNEAVYVGDLRTDVQAARAAFMRSAVVTFGYHGPHENIQSWGADFVAQTTEALTEWLLR